MGAHRWEFAANLDAEVGLRRSINRVLVVDDDDKLLRAYKRVAGERTILTTNDVETARALARSEQPDLVIVDLRLGSGSGLDLIRYLRAELAQARIVLCSAYVSVATTVTAVHAGADMVLFKPVTLSEIVKRFEEDQEETNLGDDDTPTLARAEWEHIMRVLADCDGNVTLAARRLGIYRSSLQRKLRKYAPQS
jgi:two-component system, response regulator RegA